ncbi:MAG: hypothetical protein MAGBODY4_00406 [Candidatus Marinimicrobia bacterium]|nr:hypothetical protein [Candidatus Neomarinimicrobiota bacterium]
MSSTITPYFWIFLMATAVILILAVGLIVGFLFWNKRLNEEQEFSSIVIENLPIPLLILDTSGTILDVNPAFERLLGLQTTDLSGKSISRLPMLPEQLTDWIQDGARSENAPDSLQEPSLAMTATGDDRSIRWTWAVYPRQSDVAEKIILYAEDVTDLQAAEGKLQYLEALLQSAPDIMMIADSQGNILFVTSSVQQHLGYSPDELRGHNWWMYLEEKEAFPGSREYAARAARGVEEIPKTSYSQIVTHADGTPVQIQWQDKKGPKGLLLRYGRIQSV